MHVTGKEERQRWDVHSVMASPVRLRGRPELLAAPEWVSAVDDRGDGERAETSAVVGGLPLDWEGVVTDDDSAVLPDG